MACISLTCFAEEIAIGNAVSQEMHLCSICWKTTVSTYFKIADKWNGKPGRSAHKLNSGSGPPAAHSSDGRSLLLREIFPRGKIHAALRQSVQWRKNHLLHGKKRTSLLKDALKHRPKENWRGQWVYNAKAKNSTSAVPQKVQTVSTILGLSCHSLGGFLWERKSARWFCTPDGYIARRLNRWDQPT